jgi:uncharacterized glyoxalase superfamily protein PhnB
MAQSIFPALRYRDARAAIEWLTNAFGFEPTMVVDGENGSVAHAELKYGDEWVMLASVSEGEGRLPQPPGGSSDYNSRQRPGYAL